MRNFCSLLFSSSLFSVWN